MHLIQSTRRLAPAYTRSALLKQGRAPAYTVSALLKQGIAPPVYTGSALLNNLQGIAPPAYTGSALLKQGIAPPAYTGSALLKQVLIHNPYSTISLPSCDMHCSKQMIPPRDYILISGQHATLTEREGKAPGCV